MSVAKTTEIIASSTVSFQDAIEQGVARASKTLRDITGAWVAEEKAVVKDGKVIEWRVTMRVTFILAD
jgi:flavin-binding protein dodecin